MISARRSLQIHAVVAALYVALVGWWITFFWRQGPALVEEMAAAGAPLDEPQVRALTEAGRATTRMFMYEGAFLGALLLVSFLLVLRALRREVALQREQANFLSAVTHELRSPLASARLYVESLQLGRATGEKAERYLRHANEDLDRLQRLVEELLESRRLAHTEPDVRPERMELREQVARALDRRAASDGDGPEVVLAPGEPVEADVDPRALEAIVGNLVGNAVKYGGEGGPVEVSVARADGPATIEVRDHGPGLVGVDRERIFEPFLRGGDESVRTHPGVGLGLFIVAKLVRAHGGTVSARDASSGGGAILRVELPEAAG